jgi:hypothetical protein
MLVFFEQMIKSAPVLIVMSALFLGGCSSGLSGLLGGKTGGPSGVTSVPVGNQLALPPDLSLKAPSSTQATYQPNTATGEAVDGSDNLSEIESTETAALAPKRKVEGDIYDQYGISKFKPDGTKKADWELRAELRAAILKKKREKNPRYGTFMNVGGLFRDE